MSNALRGWNDYISNVPLGTHVCEFYTSPEELTETLPPYFAAGLEKDELCLWVTSDPSGAEAAKTGLKKAAPYLSRFIDEGQIQIFDYHDWYLHGGHFDSDRVFGQWTEKEKRSVEDGYKGIRATGDMAWLQKKDWPEFMQYEAEVNRAFPEHRIIGLCTYCLDTTPANRVLDVLRNHQCALAQIAGSWQMMPFPAEQLHRLAADVLEERDKDRRWISSQLHEETAQSVSAITLYLEGLQQRSWPSEVRFILAKCQAVCDQSLEEILALARQLHPSLLDELGLSACLRQYIDDFVKRTHVQVELETGHEFERMPQVIETHLFYVAKESLSNVFSHSGSARAVVRLQRKADVAVLQIQDFGQGMRAASRKTGLGLLRMQERLRKIGGRLEIASDNQGTIVTARIRL